MYQLKYYILQLHDRHLVHLAMRHKPQNFGQFHSSSFVSCSPHGLSLWQALLAACGFPQQMFYDPDISNFPGLHCRFSLILPASHIIFSLAPSKDWDTTHRFTSPHRLSFEIWEETPIMPQFLLVKPEPCRNTKVWCHFRQQLGPLGQWLLWPLSDPMPVPEDTLP